jgi:hypothetical protein
MNVIGGIDCMHVPVTWEKKMRGRDDKIIQATQKELNLVVRLAGVS